MTRPDAIVVFPPPMDRIDRLYSAPHFLCTFVNSRGFTARPVDLNLAALHRLAHSPLLVREAEIVGQKRTRLEEKKRLSMAEKHAHHKLIEAQKRLESARRVRSGLGNEYDLMALEIAGTRFTRLFREPYLKTFAPFYGTDMLSVERIRSLAEGAAARKIVELLEEDLSGRIAATGAPVVGFSIPFSQQLAPAAALAKRLKDLMDGVHICFGGPVITLLSEGILREMHRQLAVDSFVQYEGEQPLLSLVEAMREKKPLPRVAGLVTFEKRDNAAGRSRRSDPSASSPDYEHNRFEPGNIRHLPRTAKIPIRQSAGCYWKKCNFCDYINLHRDKRYRPRSVEAIMEDIRYYADMGFTRFRMLTEAIPPKNAARIAETIAKEGLDIRWHSFIRVDRRFTPEIFRTLKESGFSCTVGMESANERVLKILNKGYGRKTIENFIDHMKQAAFSGNHLNVMVGVPGETYQEALETFEFCRTTTAVFSWFKPSLFTLTATSDMGRHPEKYGIILRSDENGSGPDRHGGRLTGLDFEDPGGMSAAQKAEVAARYEALNAKGAGGGQTDNDE